MTQNQINQKITCLQIIPFLGTGGIERGVLDTFRYLHGINIKNYIFCENYNSELLKDHELKFVFKTNNKKFKNIFNQNSIKKQLNEIISNCQINLIHISSRAPAFFLHKFIKNLSITYVTSFHNPYRHQNFIKKYYNSFLLKGDKVIANSFFTKDHILKYYNSNKEIIVIQRGVDLSYFDPKLIEPKTPNELKLTLNIGPNDKIFILPSRLTSWKGHQLFLKNLSNLKLNDDYPFKIIFFSNDKILINILKKSATDLGLKNNLIILNETSDIRIYYSLCDLVISSSTKPEGFGRTVSEALAMGKLLIAPNQGGTKEQLEAFDKNLLYDISSLQSFKKALMYALSNLENDKNKRRDYIISNFSLDSMIRKTIEVYGIK